MSEKEIDTFKLRVKEIVDEMLKTRDLTIPEVNKIKDAIKETWELLLDRHQRQCLDERAKNCSKHISALNEIEKVVDRELHSSPCSAFNDLRAALEKTNEKLNAKLLSDATDRNAALERAIQARGNEIEADARAKTEKFRHEQNVLLLKVGLGLTLLSIIVSALCSWIFR